MRVQYRGFSLYEFQQDPRYEIVTTPAQLERMVSFLSQQKLIAFDFETSGTAWWRHAAPAGLAFSAKADDEEHPRNLYVPYRHQTGQYQLSPQAVIEAVGPIFKNPQIAKIAHHLKFDWHFLNKDGIELKGVLHDTMILAHLYDENSRVALKHRALVDLEDDDAHLHEELLSLEVTRLAKIAGLGKKAYLDRFGYAGIDMYLCGQYACHDTQMTWGLFHKYQQLGVQSYYEELYQTEIDLIGVLVEMEETGLQIDIPYLQKLHETLSREKERQENIFFQVAGCKKFNLGSDDALRDYLVDGLKLKLTKKTKKGQLSVDEKVLSSFISVRPHLAALVRWRDVEKKLSTYTTSLIEKTDEFGVLHPDFRQIGTNCMPVGELVLTDHGYLPVEKIYPGYSVLTHKGRARKVLVSGENGTAPIYRVTLSNGVVLRTTGNHAYKTPQGWLEAQDLRADQPVLVHSDPEEWLKIEAWPDFSVSSWGRVRNDKTDYILALQPKNQWGHLKVTLRRNGCQERGEDLKDLAVHRLVAQAFLPVPESTQIEIRHLNGISWDNEVGNLAWGTSNVSRELVRDVRLGKRWQPEKDPNPNTFFRSATVVSVAVEPSEVVYGLSVAEDHSHVTGGVVTHSTGRFSASEPNPQNIPSDDKDRKNANDGVDPESIKQAFIIQRNVPPDEWQGKKLCRHYWDYCLAVGTLVDTPKGDTPIEDLREGDLVYTYNHKTSKPDCSKITAHKFTGTLPTLVVVLDNGKRVRCTSKHRWLRADGTEIYAKDLQVGDRLLPLRRGKAGQKGYETLYSRSATQYVYTHKAVATAQIGIEVGRIGTVIHHIDENHLNNDPGNLEVMDEIQHKKLHGVEVAKAQWADLATRKKMSAGIRRSLQARGGHHGKKNPNYGNLKGEPKQCPGCNRSFYKPPSVKAKYCSTDCYWAVRRGEADRNHKVVAIEFDGLCVPTYDIEVARDHNFALSAGVFVHNSQIELRVLAHYSRDEALVTAYVEGKDIHDEVERAVFGTSGVHRREAKCFHPDTEVLTPEGWVLISKLKKEQEVAQAFPGRDGSVDLEWVVPTELFERPNSQGHLIHLQNEGMDLRVTHDHRMLGWNRSGSPQVVEPAHLNSVRYWANAGVMHQGSWTPPMPLLRLAVATQADGSFAGNRIRFGFTRSRKIERMRELLSVFSDWQEGTSSQGVTTFTLNERLTVRIQRLLTNKSFSWQWLELGYAHRLVVLDEAKHWDGPVRPNWRHFRYSNTDLSSIEVLQALATLSGFKTRISFWDPPGAKHRRCYQLTVRDRNSTRGGNLRAHTVPYDGPVVCLAVPSSFLVVRDSNAKIPVVTGQCVNFGLSYMLSPQGLAAQIGSTIDRALEIFDNHNKSFPGIEIFREQFFKTVRQSPNGGIHFFHNMFGRTRRISGMTSTDKWERRRAERQCIATLIQGTAAQLTKITLVRAHRWLKEQGLTTRFVLTVHDEIQADGPVEEFAEVARGIKKVAEDFPQFAPIPILTGCEATTKSWAQKTEIKGLDNRVDLDPKAYKRESA